jgi:sucrose-6-phosphate hydrolase SacC (GH32 family)
MHQRTIPALAFVLLVDPDAVFASVAEKPLRDKTLVVWAAPANLSQRGGSALTIDDGSSHFDAIVFGEIAPGRWMAGSDAFRRTAREQSNWPVESADSRTLVQVAIVYEGKRVTIYRNGQTYAQYAMGNAPHEFRSNSVVVMGMRHLDQGDEARFAGVVDDARIYDVALSAEQITALKPNNESTPEPWAWWTFDETGLRDRTGRFAFVRLVGGGKLEDGKLVLDGRTGTLIAARTAEILASLAPAADPVPAVEIEAARRLRHRLLGDPHRPTYHFAIPEDYAMPFDPNGAIFWNGRYHLFYIYQERGTHVFGHVSSTDLLHWRHHPPAVFPTADSPEKGIFSGNCFINKQGEATMLYHGVGVGNCIATSSDDLLENWKKLPGNPIISNPPSDKPYASWDPHGWLEGDTYYAIFGGTRAAVFKAQQLDKWNYVGDLLHHSLPGVDLREDISCPDFFRLGNKSVLVCISHRLGARYYLGVWSNEQFHPEFHERMSWVDNTFFAPESLTDPSGRRVMWAWIFDGRSPATRRASGWSGEMSLPRELFLDKNGRLGQRPIEELIRLRYREQSTGDRSLEPDEATVLNKIVGDAIELELVIELRDAKQCGVIVRRATNGEEQTLVYYDAVEHALKVDVTKASLAQGSKTIESGPLQLSRAEDLRLRVFVDRSIVEAFANDRQAVLRRIYPTRRDSVGVALFSNGGAARVRQFKAWQMAPTNPY